jgi:hypothetical protein
MDHYQTEITGNLRIPMSNLHMQFEPYRYIKTKVTERKLSFQ